MRKYGEIDEGMTKTYQLFEEIIIDTEFGKHLEHYIESFTAENDGRFVTLAGEVFMLVLEDRIKEKRLTPIIEEYLNS